MDAQHTPQRFGRYVLLDRMGAGGMAEVFRAVVPGAEGFRRDLVVKRILSERARTANFIEMFVHEARISALLHHPNVVQVFDFGQVDGSYFLAMELLRGRDLLAVLRAVSERQTPFPLPIACHVAHQVALGLAYAHSLTSPDGQPLNIVHRDVSPSNIMLLRTGGVKLLDFGIAQAIGEMDSDTSDRSSFKGKVCYMAPERLRDEAQDGRVDVFALGAVLWEMLAGRRLFHGKTDVDKLRSVLEKRVPLPSSFRPEVPAALDDIVLKALARDPAQRYATAQELADDLEVVVNETKYHSRMMPAFMTQLFGSAPSAAHHTLSMLSPELLACEPMITPALTPALPRTIEPALSEATQVDVEPWHGRPVMLNGRLGRWNKAVLAGVALVAIGAAAVAIHGRRADVRPGAERLGKEQSAAPMASPGTVAASEAPAAVAAPVNLGAGVSAGGEAAGAATGSAAAEVRTTAPASDPATGKETAGTLPAARANVRASTKTNANPGPHPLAPPRRQAPAPRAVVPARPAARPAAGRITRGLSIDPFAEAAARGPQP